MQLQFALFTLAACVTAVAALPQSQSQPWTPGGCLTEASANEIVAIYQQALQLSGNQSAEYDALNSQILSTNSAEISDSVDFFLGLPAGSVTAPTLAAQEQQHLSSPGYFEVITLNVFYSCNVITWRYRLILAPNLTPVQGINIFVLNSQGLIETTYIEFNSVVLAEDTGCTVTCPPGRIG
jgi:hypothetical protein